MFNVLFLQTIIIHPKKYNLPLSRCVDVSSEWMSKRASEWERERERKKRRKEFRWNQHWAPADLRILHYFTVYTHKWGYNETMIRCSRSFFSTFFSFAFYKYDMFLLLRSLSLSRLVVIITFFFTFCVLHCCSLWALFVEDILYEVKLKQGSEWETINGFYGTPPRRQAGMKKKLELT